MSEVEAELIFTRANRAPEVVLSFNGLAVPQALFGELHSIGWSVPTMPPPPGSAIDWTPDPTTGADYTLKPWRVHEFKLQPANWWTAETEKTIGATTIEALKRHGATISGLRGGQEVETPAAPTEAGPDGAAGSENEASTAQGIVIVIEKDAGPGVDGMTPFSSISSRQRDSWNWSEGTQSDPTILNELASRGAMIWSLNPDNRPNAPKGAVALHFLAMGKDASASQIKKLQGVLGAASSVHALEKVTAEDGTLVCAVVPANAADMLLSNVRLRFPKLVCRTAAG